MEKRWSSFVDLVTNVCISALYDTGSLGRSSGGKARKSPLSSDMQAGIGSSLKRDYLRAWSAPETLAGSAQDAVCRVDCQSRAGQAHSAEEKPLPLQTCKRDLELSNLGIHRHIHARNSKNFDGSTCRLKWGKIAVVHMLRAKHICTGLQSQWSYFTSSIAP